MDPVHPFNALVAELRGQRGMTVQEVAAAVRALLPDAKTSHQSVSQWGTDTIPKDRRTIEALDEVLGASGRLVDLAGVQSSRLDEIEDRLGVIEDLVRELKADRRSG